jgi:hypothetical protein
MAVNHFRIGEALFFGKDLFTGNTYSMVVMVGEASKISPTLTKLNISAAKKHFEKFIPENTINAYLKRRFFPGNSGYTPEYLVSSEKEAPATIATPVVASGCGRSV